MDLFTQRIQYIAKEVDVRSMEHGGANTPNITSSYSLQLVLADSCAVRDEPTEQQTIHEGHQIYMLTIVMHLGEFCY